MAKSVIRELRVEIFDELYTMHMVFCFLQLGEAELIKLLEQVNQTQAKKTTVKVIKLLLWQQYCNSCIVTLTKIN